ncbi:MAG: hypothetical protein HGA65_16245 [Oscillochloris sp.]|nr:hypothetical protein [Oscillochloris sp.]
MGPGESQLTPDDLLAAAEAETRHLLAHYGEPTPAIPPPDLTNRVIDALSARPRHAFSRLRRIYTGLIAVGAFSLFALGVWGVLLDSSGPAHLAGDLSSGLSQLMLLLTLAAKPLINLLLTAGAATLAVLVAILGGSWLWWQLLRRELASSLEAPA